MSFVDDVMESSIRSKHTSTPPLHSSYQRVDSFEPQNNQSPRVVAEETPVVGGGVTGVTEAEGSTTGGTNKQTSHRSKHESAPAPPKGIAALGNRPRSSSSTKALLTMALLEAQSAVQKDNDGNISEALDSYSKAVTLLGKVMEAASTQDERERLKIIHDSYRFRMHLLATPPSLPTQQSVITPETNNERQSEGAMETQVVQSTLGTETAQNVQESRKIQSNDEEKPQATAPVEEYTKSTPPPRPPPPPPGSLDLPLSLKEALKEQGVTFDDPSPPLRPPTLGLPPLPMSPPPIPPRNPPPPPPRSPPPLASILGPAPLPPQSVAASASTSTIRSHAQATSVQMHAMPLNAMASVENTGASTTTAMTAISGGISQIAMVRKDAPPKQTKKNRAVSHGPPAAAPAPPTGEPKTRRLRAESASVGLSGTNNFSKLENTSNENGSSLARNRYRTKTFAGVPRTAQTDLEHQPQPQAHPSPTLPSQQQPQQQQLQQRRVRDKEQKPKFVILKSAPTVPLPPPPPRTSGPTTEPLQAADSTSAQSRDVSAMHAMPMSPLMSPPMSPPVPQVPPLRPNRVSAASKFTKSGTPTLTAAHMTFSSMGDGSNNGRPLSPPPTSPPPIIPVSPPLSPTNPGRRIRPLYQQLMPQPPIKSPEQQQQQQQQLPESQAEVQEQKQDGKEQKGQVEGLATLHEDEREESHSSESSSSHRISHSSASSVEKEASLTINSTMANQTQSTTKKGLESSANASADPDTLVEVWLPNLLNTSFATSKIFLDHLEQPSDSTPQDQVFLKGWYKSTQHGQEDIPPVPSMPPVPPLPAGYSQQSPEMQSVEQMQSPTTSTLPTSSTITTKASPLALSLESQQLLDTLSRATANAMAALESHSGAATTKPATRTQEAISPKLLPSRTISATTTATKIMDSNSSNSSNSDSNNNNNSPINANLKPNGSGSGNCQNNADTNTNSNNNSKGSSSNNQNSPTIAAPATMATTNNTGTGRELSLQDVISQDPFAGLKTPIPPHELDPPPPADRFLRCFWFMHLLEQTMTTGGFLSPKLYVPRNIWYQKTAVRLPAIDAKIHACQTLSQTLDRMVAQSKSGKLTLLVELGGRVEKGEKDRAMLLHELAALENLTQELWVKLSKKMSFIHRPNKNQSVGSGSANGGTLMLGLQQQGYRPSHLYQNQALYNPSTQTHRHGDQNQSDEHGPSSASDPYSWLGSEEMWASTLQSGGLTAGSISSGSVSSGTLTGSSMVTSPVSEKGSGNNNNTSHKRVTSGGAASDLKSQWKSFSKSVQKSIATDKIEDTTSYTEALIQLFQSSYILESMLKHFEALPPHQTHFKILGRLQRISDFYNLVVCAFVIRDLGELMSKYVKRMGAAVAE